MFIPIELAMRPSRIYAGILLLAHGLALTGLWLAELPLTVRLIATGLLMMGAYVLWRTEHVGPRGLRVTQSGQIEIFMNDWQPAVIKGQPVALPWLVSLTAQPENGKACRLMIWPDTVDADSLRKLRVWLKWGYQAG